MIEKIRIKNYRGIKSLEIDNLKKYNFFIGNNGSSKTTSLEAIFSAIPNDGNAIVIMANSRGMQVKLSNNNSFFYNSNISDDIEFTLNDDITTKISLKNINRLNNNLLNSNNYNEFIYNISVFEKNNKTLYESNFGIDPSNRIFPIEIKTNIEWNEYIEKYGRCFWISPLTKYQYGIAQITKEMIENKKKEYILKAIGFFEEDIDDIVSDGTEVLLSKKGVGKMLPISSFGGGLSSALDIITCLFYDGITSIFIDEAETGLHYTNFPKFCEVLIDISTNKNIQFFITTHSDEFLKDFYNILVKKRNEDITTYRFQKIDSDIKIVYYPYERAIRALKDGWDIR
ncbi:AAA family ATPase [Fusobacterium vincentii]|uniref:AAA family ATPase n=1 Tax=Fusobacterium vincentii TaxID=155615 RepID=UPI001C6F2BB4|nr:AAA family ATPase [Fusobacterium vincentii]QYR56224.1 AAA family ATPase [Fusobacterium vincentii]